MVLGYGNSHTFIHNDCRTRTGGGAYTAQTPHHDSLAASARHTHISLTGAQLDWAFPIYLSNGVPVAYQDCQK